MSALISLLISLTVTIAVAILLLGRIERRIRPRKLMEELRSEISGVIVELNATTDRNIQLLEDRILQIKELLDSADRKITLLHTELAKADRGDQLYVQLRKAKQAGKNPESSAPSADQGATSAPSASGASAVARDAEDAGASAVLGAPGRAASQADQDGQTGKTGEAGQAAASGQTGQAGQTGQQAANPGDDPGVHGEPPAANGRVTPAAVSGAPAVDAAGASPESAAEMTAHQRMRAKVWELYAMGEKLERIAARVGRTEGEIELMISLLHKDEP
ncbi:hypothetical protein [Spirochaeta africana]|uniref:Uncharacterized protein n=1 Tax=Spirochaeta africana (strain ATCC 700263 / DSM 8902 / Z-7692) TaxID=889378 RepID=H9UKT3_SPIAZ|nr:hypothetical protein [Spirochaeta africana]AFG38126.1 hypothetical protein Spiaf_2078 [Spirochaeta africana DSM 8902]